MAIRITRRLLETATRQLARLTGEREFVAVGRSTLAITAPPRLRGMAVSDDVDMWPRAHEDAALDESNAALGEGSPFHEKQGFYVERIGSWTLLTQPPGWEERASRIQFGSLSVLVLGLLDLAYNKLEASRPKDNEFLREAFAAGLVTPTELRDFVEQHALTPDLRQQMIQSLTRLTEH